MPCDYFKTPEVDKLINVDSLTKLSKLIISFFLQGFDGADNGLHFFTSTILYLKRFVHALTKVIDHAFVQVPIAIIECAL